MIERTVNAMGGAVLLRWKLGVAVIALAALLTRFPAVAQTPETDQSRQSNVNPSQHKADMEQELLDLSRSKWQWMSERKVDALDGLFHQEAVFVHMGGTMTKAQELEVIETGRIQYKKAEIQEASVRVIGTTAIVLNRVRLLAAVGGNDVINPFVVTEVYVQEGNAWKLASLSFTRLLGQ